MSRQLYIRTNDELGYTPSSTIPHTFHKSKRKEFTKHRHTRTLNRIWKRSIGMNEKLPKNSSPYLGYLRHAPITTSKFRRSRVFGSEVNRYPHVQIHSSASPYVGFIRHAPPSARSRRSNRSTSRNKFEEKSKAVWEGYLEQYNCSGHLPGGCTSDNRKFTTYSLCRWFEVSPSSRLFQLEDMTNNIYTRDVQVPLGSLDMLNKLAHWFLFPIANDATYTFKDCNEVDYLHGIKNIFVPFFSSILRKVLTIDFSLSVGTTFGSDADANMQNQLICQVSSSSSLSNVNVIQRQESDEELVARSEGNNLFRSISSIDSDEIMSHDQRHLDIESILKIPTVTFGDTNSNDGVINIDDSSHDASSHVNDRKGLEWSWIAVPKDMSESTESIESLPQAQSVQQRDDKCVICLEAFRTGDRLRVLPCGHRFHCGCIDKWLSGSFSDVNCVNSSCPTCKSIPILEEENSGPSSIESMVSMGSLVELCDDDSMQSLNLDGSMPSWAFARLGSKISD